MDLFEYREKIRSDDSIPLAERMRPGTFDDFIGQPHITEENSLVRRAVEKDRLFSMILWGPPGCGKTSLANIIARETSFSYVQLSAVLSGVKDIRDVIDNAKTQRNLHGRRTLLFVDEIHRFNKSQQDAFLPHVESGLITLIGATTENPSFEIIPALMSRCRVVIFNSHEEDEIVIVLKKALSDSVNGLGRYCVSMEESVLKYIASISDGDIRAALNSLEAVVSLAFRDGAEGKDTSIADIDTLKKLLQKKAILYDKSGEEHYNLISAFHKSLRGSDPDAVIYWLARMLVSGEDPFYVARRMVRFASEDIGMADNNALVIAMKAVEAYRFLGPPEGELALVQAAVYLATAPKSNRLYTAFKSVKNCIDKTGFLPVPHHIRNSPTELMKDFGYGKDYKYPHDHKDGFVVQSYLPEKIVDQLFYFPCDRGYEKIVAQRLSAWRDMKKGL